MVSLWVSVIGQSSFSQPSRITGALCNGALFANLSAPLRQLKHGLVCHASGGYGRPSTTELGYRREDSKAAELINLSTVADAEISNPSWVKFQSAGWVNFPSAPTGEKSD
jgi:hypothetical protein